MMNSNTMSTDATKLQTSQALDSNAVLLKKTRHDKHESNQGRVRNSYHDEHGNLKNSTAYEGHELRLKFLLPFLESLPDQKLHQPAKDLASVVLTTSIARRQRKESLLLNTESEKIPASARYKFKLTPSDKVKNTP